MGGACRNDRVMARFFVEKKDIQGDTACLYGDDARHIEVLRLSAGDAVTLCDGEGMDYEAEIMSVSKAEARFRIVSKYKSDTESEYRITLFQGMPKSDKLDIITQKCVELGVDTIAPFYAARSVVKSEGGNNDKKLVRLKRIAYEAAKQSRRGRIPDVRIYSDLRSIDFSGFELVVAAYEDERETTLKHALRAFQESGGGRSIALIVGPEGGFERSEIDFIKSAGGVTVTLGSRILRTETAGMALVAMTLYELEVSP